MRNKAPRFVQILGFLSLISSFLIIAIFIGGCSLLITGKFSAAIIAVFALAIIYITIKHIIIKNFAGVTGDTLGAIQQISEAALLLVFLTY